MRNLTHIWPQSGHFCPKLGSFFPIFEKEQGRPPPVPLSPSSCAPGDHCHIIGKNRGSGSAEIVMSMLN